MPPRNREAVAAEAEVAAVADTDRIRGTRLTLFTVAEANRIVEEIAPEMEALVQAGREAARVQARIDVLELAIAGASDDNPDVLELKSLNVQRIELKALLQRGLKQVHRHGCVIKDLGQGLVDFYALNGDRLIFLCWKLGEPEVSHWHALDGGFATRRPVPRGDAA